ncbi:MAG: Hsp20/alpha crystallin family protein [Rhodobacteraceae bacterium]|nr:Hsp20/alpha crystallin family protein [Paracoccaceae bacterium]
MVEKSGFGGLWPTLFEPFRVAGTRIAEWLAPASEASSGEEGYRIALELPGVAEADIHLAVEGGVVTVRGEKRSSREEKGDTWYFSERQYGAFSRSFRLPADADDAKVAAELKDGVLTITVPRRAAAGTAAKRVPIARG